MTTDQVRVLALALTALWVLSALLAIGGHRVAAVVLNVLFALPLCLIALVPLVRMIIDRDAYIRQYGQAALSDLPSTIVLLASGLLAVGASLFSLRRKGWLFLIGWLANAPTLAFVIYLAFWFQIF